VIRVLHTEWSDGWGGQEKKTVRLINYLNDEPLANSNIINS
jgi:hypothetical protein